MNLNITITFAKPLDVRLTPSAALMGALQTIIQQGAKMSAELDRLTTEVSEATTVQQSAITLLNSLAQQIRDNANDPAKLNALADELDGSSNALAAAVEANTPAAPPAP